MYLERIQSPDDVKKLSMAECNVLAQEIRDALIEKASAFGGHLASNLGAVEPTIALHYVFDSPKDKIVFDVSHQCYTHKILTGRKEGFTDPAHYNDYNGYTNPNESAHDFFRVGHSATSISLACGLAKARDLRGSDENVIAFIGDGAMSGGEAFEGLDFGGSELEGGLIVVFNDNQMSIPENHGGIYSTLETMRETAGQCLNNLFKAFGYDYVYVEKGNDIESLVTAFSSVKDTKRPVVVHICTTKGKGYGPAESRREQTHWMRPFDKQSGEEKNPFEGERYDRIVRDHLIERIQHDPAVVAMIAAVPDALSFSPEHRKMCGRQFVDVGIAEEHAVSMAAGLAKQGYKPVFSTFSTFFQRTYDQISQELCINKAPVCLLVVNASVYAANDITHIGIFDIPMMSNIPNLVYLAPTNKQEYLAMIDWAIDQADWPVAIRAPRNGVFYANGSVDADYSVLNKYQVVRQGSKIAILALGDFFQMGERVADAVATEMGIVPTLVNPRYITGLDEGLLDSLKAEHRLVVTLEDGVLDGGWGQKVASFYGSSDVRVLNFGLRKEFLDRYDVAAVMEANRLREDLILSDIQSLL